MDRDSPRRLSWAFCKTILRDLRQPRETGGSSPFERHRLKRLFKRFCLADSSPKREERRRATSGVILIPSREDIGSYVAKHDNKSACKLVASAAANHRRAIPPPTPSVLRRADSDFGSHGIGRDRPARPCISQRGTCRATVRCGTAAHTGDSGRSAVR
jgi:hypothetical protein